MAIGTLFVVGTPLGNLDDLSPRAVRVLGAAKVVAAEDTRTAQKLWARFGIAPHTVSYFEGNEASRAAELVERLRAGDDVALISEAGMPGVSDPGERLVREAALAGAKVVVVPGPSAAVTALAGSGLPTARFTFVGFLPQKQEARDALLARLRPSPETLIFYEAPGRTAATLADLARHLGGARRACVARELTKIHEEYLRGTLDALSTRAGEAAPRGEVTLVVEGAPEGASAEAPIDLEREVDARLAAGQSPREIAAALALATGKPRRQLYQLALARRPRDDDGDDDDG
jgi:16S rRNA (cytidine1402-2'-O)-methyltransferase